MPGSALDYQAPSGFTTGETPKMPIAPQVPGVPTTVTPDASPPIYTSVQGPAPDGYVVADDVLAVHLEVLNVQQRILPYVPGARASTMIYAPDESGWPLLSGGGGALTDWQIDVNSPHWQQYALFPTFLVVPVSSVLPPTGKINSVTMNIKPATGHGGGLPATMPTIALRSAAYYERLTTTIDTASDATIGAFYETSHDVTLALTPLTIDPLSKYWIYIQGEYGVNSFTGLIVNSVRIGIIP